MASFSLGWNIVVITCTISAQVRDANFREKLTEVRKHNQCACSRSFLSPGWNSVSITWDFFRFSGPFGRGENPSSVCGLGFSARADLRPMLIPSPCNRQLGFQKICFRSWSEISARPVSRDEIRHVMGPLVWLGVAGRKDGRKWQVSFLKDPLTFCTVIQNYGCSWCWAERGFYPIHKLAPLFFFLSNMEFEHFINNYGCGKIAILLVNLLIYYPIKQHLVESTRRLTKSRWQHEIIFHSLSFWLEKCLP